ncbi:cell wall hydrolase [Fredinandcohnia sp. 179-A 10B2 NHS]|uniref:cell wall hydrolase n=1 Tax=Fredinandcohnia sp. 179-A 10B2 NHS TaxID=3235176 RepID=UPI00399F9EB2
MKKFIFGLALLASLFFADEAFAYTVQDGDTMSDIAREVGVTLEELAKANPQVEDLDLIFPGQHINTDFDTNSPELSKGVHYIEDMKEEVKVATTESAPKEETKVASVSTNVKYTEAEIDLLARIVRAEALGESFEGKVAVAAVVLNRVESPKFPDTIRGVIYQRGQFSPVSNGSINKPADKESIRAAYAAMTDMRHIAKDALFFYNPDIATSRWLDSRATAVVIGNHVFKY